MKKYAIIVAGGSGTRMNSEVPKQFLLLKGRPILFFTIEAFYNYSQTIEIILTLPRNYIEFWNKLCRDYKFEIKHTIVEGGEYRFYSVKNAISLVNESGFVAIHDGVRPLVSQDTISRCFENAKIFGNAIPCLRMNESVREISTEGNKAVERAKYRAIQTPQVFKSETIKSAYNTPFKDIYTDDASVVEANNNKIFLVDGNSENIKITTPTDIAIAEVLLSIKK
jgi:2-C-methyl-D-erythritol 4-phosphate cytidylyltransferase